MRILFQKPFYILMLTVITSCLIITNANAQDPTENLSPEIEISQAEDISAFWTEDMMDKAEPYPMPETDDSVETNAEATEVPLGPPELVGGTLPFSDAEPQSWQGEEPQDYLPPGNPANYPPPHSRHTYFAKYSNHPMSTIGKLFFCQDGDGNGIGSCGYECSGAVIYAGMGQKDVIATAGHCLSNGLNGRGYNNGWSYNIRFCPSWYSGGVAPLVGCWDYTTNGIVVKNGWFTYGNPGGLEYDVGCVVARNYGSRWNNHIGDVTGTLGTASNWGADEPTSSFGYPGQYPFDGNRIVQAFSVEWYTRNLGGAADYKYMGNDMTPGSSGGPWVLGWGRSAGDGEFPDTDGNIRTDPPGQLDPNWRYAGGYINGVNSSRRGGYSQEMGSPQFNNSSPNTESLWATCQAMANSSP